MNRYRYSRLMNITFSTLAICVVFYWLPWPFTKNVYAIGITISTLLIIGSFFLPRKRT
jgi:hypothetical protein